VQKSVTLKSKTAPESGSEAANRKPGNRANSKFNERRELILDAATVLMNNKGLKGMRLVEVGEMAHLNTTGVTYYFRFKEQLAAAVFEHTLQRLETIVRLASLEASPRARVSRFLEQIFDVHERVVLKQERRPLAILSDIRALEEPARSELMKHYQEVFRIIRSFFGPVDDPARKLELTARAHMLMEVVFWVEGWIHDYSLADFKRVRLRLFDILERGVALPGQKWWPAIDRNVSTGDDQSRPDSHVNLLRAATSLINKVGYRGTSVESIVAELNVTKGSFYHHLEAKDDLVMECFRRSFRLISAVQRVATARGGSQWDRLSSAISTLVWIQFFGDWPLLRSTALHALPPELHSDMRHRANRKVMQFAGLLADGIIDGVIRPIDPVIGSRVIMATLNAAFDIRKWASTQSEEQAVATYVAPLIRGIFD
jgi:AcrR family transcriptional regulator